MFDCHLIKTCQDYFILCIIKVGIFVGNIQTVVDMKCTCINAAKHICFYFSNNSINCYNWFASLGEYLFVCHKFPVGLSAKVMT